MLLNSIQHHGSITKENENKMKELQLSHLNSRMGQQKSQYIYAKKDNMSFNSKCRPKHTIANAVLGKKVLKNPHGYFKINKSMMFKNLKSNILNKSYISGPMNNSMMLKENVDLSSSIRSFRKSLNFKKSSLIMSQLFPDTAVTTLRESKKLVTLPSEVFNQLESNPVIEDSVRSPINDIDNRDRENTFAKDNSTTIQKKNINHHHPIIDQCDELVILSDDNYPNHTIKSTSSECIQSDCTIPPTTHLSNLSDDFLQPSLKDDISTKTINLDKFINTYTKKGLVSFPYFPKKNYYDFMHSPFPCMNPSKIPSMVPCNKNCCEYIVENHIPLNRGFNIYQRGISPSSSTPIYIKPYAHNMIPCLPSQCNNAITYRKDPRVGINSHELKIKDQDGNNIVLEISKEDISKIEKLLGFHSYHLEFLEYTLKGIRDNLSKQNQNIKLLVNQNKSISKVNRNPRRHFSCIAEQKILDAMLTKAELNMNERLYHSTLTRLNGRKSEFSQKTKTFNNQCQTDDTYNEGVTSKVRKLQNANDQIECKNMTSPPKRYTNKNNRDILPSKSDVDSPEVNSSFAGIQQSVKENNSFFSSALIEKNKNQHENNAIEMKIYNQSIPQDLQSVLLQPESSNKNICSFFVVREYNDRDNSNQIVDIKEIRVLEKENNRLSRMIDTLESRVLLLSSEVRTYHDLEHDLLDVMDKYTIISEEKTLLRNHLAELTSYTNDLETWILSQAQLKQDILIPNELPILSMNNKINSTIASNANFHQPLSPSNTSILQPSTPPNTGIIQPSAPSNTGMIQPSTAPNTGMIHNSEELNTSKSEIENHLENVQPRIKSIDRNLIPNIIIKRDDSIHRAGIVTLHADQVNQLPYNSNTPQVQLKDYNNLKNHVTQLKKELENEKFKYTQLKNELDGIKNTGEDKIINKNITINQLNSEIENLKSIIDNYRGQRNYQEQFEEINLKYHEAQKRNNVLSQKLEESATMYEKRLTESKHTLDNITNEHDHNISIIQNLTTENKKLKNDLTVTTRLLKEAESTIVNLSADGKTEFFNIITNQTNDTDAQIENIKVQLNDIKIQKEKEANIRMVLKEDLNNTEKKVAKMESIMEKINSELNRKTLEISQMTNERIMIEKELQIVKLRNKYVEKCLVEQVSTIKLQKNQILDIMNNREKFKTAFNQITDKYKALHNENAQLEIKYKDECDTVNNLKQKIENFIEKDKTYSTKVKELEEDRNNLEYSLTQRKTSIESKEAEIERLNAVIEQTKEEKNCLDSNIMVLRQIICRKENDVFQLETELKTSKQNVNLILKEKEFVEARLNNCTEKKERLTLDNKEYIVELNNIRNSKNAKIKELDQLRVKYQELLKKYDILFNERDIINTELDQYKQYYNELLVLGPNVNTPNNLNKIEFLEKQLSDTKTKLKCFDQQLNNTLHNKDAIIKNLLSIIKTGEVGDKLNENSVSIQNLIHQMIENEHTSLYSIENQKENNGSMNNQKEDDGGLDTGCSFRETNRLSGRTASLQSFSDQKELHKGNIHKARNRKDHSEFIQSSLNYTYPTEYLKSYYNENSTKPLKENKWNEDSTTFINYNENTEFKHTSGSSNTDVYCKSEPLDLKNKQIFETSSMPLDNPNADVSKLKTQRDFTHKEPPDKCEYAPYSSNSKSKGIAQLDANTHRVNKKMENVEKPTKLLKSVDNVRNRKEAKTHAFSQSQFDLINTNSCLNTRFNIDHTNLTTSHLRQNNMKLHSTPNGSYCFNRVVPPNNIKNHPELYSNYNNNRRYQHKNDLHADKTSNIQYNHLVNKYAQKENNTPMKKYRVSGKVNFKANSSNISNQSLMKNLIMSMCDSDLIQLNT